MNETDPRTRAQYEKVRDAFAHLGVQDKTAFVVEATFDTLGEAIRETGKRVADVFETISQEDFWAQRPSADAAPEAGTAPEEPAAPSASAPKPKGKSSGAAKPASDDA